MALQVRLPLKNANTEQPLYPRLHLRILAGFGTATLYVPFATKKMCTHSHPQWWMLEK